MQSRCGLFCIAAATVALVACGSSPTEPTASSPSPQTTLRIVVTKCELGGSVIVNYELGTLGTLATPGEATFYLPPGPHDLSWLRGHSTFGGSILNGAGDPVGSIPAGSTASITLTDPEGACLATPY